MSDGKKGSFPTKTIVTILLLIFFNFIGIIVMWVWTKWPLWLKLLISAPDILLFGFLFIYLFIARPYQVSGLAMFPNYHNGEYLMTRLVHSNTNLKRGDIVVFHAPIAAGCPVGTSCDFIKRIVGLPGDEVAIQNGFVSINGSKLEERYLGSDMQTLGGQFLNNNSKKIIPLGFYFILGDNRPHSSDSRQWGFVPAQDKTQEE